MAKKCSLCGKQIDVYAGHYVNAYGEAWKMSSYHEDCYRKLILEQSAGADDR